MTASSGGNRKTTRANLTMFMMLIFTVVGEPVDSHRHAVPFSMCTQQKVQESTCSALPQPKLLPWPPQSWPTFPALTLNPTLTQLQTDLNPNPNPAQTLSDPYSNVIRLLRNKGGQSVTDQQVSILYLCLGHLCAQLHTFSTSDL